MAPSTGFFAKFDNVGKVRNRGIEFAIDGAIINRKDTENITGITLDAAIEMAKEKGDMSVVADRMSSTLLLKKVTVTGNVMSDEYGPQMSVRGTELATTDVQKEAEELYSIVEGSL